MRSGCSSSWRWPSGSASSHSASAPAGSESETSFGAARAPASPDLSTALQAEGRTGEAIEATEDYLALKPRDADALRELASLYLLQLSEAQQRYQLAQARATYLAPAAAVLQGINLGDKPLELDPISNAVSSEISTEGNAALAEAQQAAGQLVATYKRLAAAVPDDPTIQLQLADAATDVGDIATAVAAYEKYLRTPGIAEADKREVQRILKQLRSQTGG
jgi:tetratricopeptide (TPR) repeat protein